jgi:RNA polymerase sigma-70 factor, ECF subfamily
MSVIKLQNPRRKLTATASNLADGEDVAAGRFSDPMAELVAGCKRGDEQAQHLLYERCHVRLFRLLVRMVGHQDAPDLLQQVFLQTFLKIGQFSGQSRFETWVYRLAINECLQFRRRNVRTQYAMPADEPVDPSGDHTERTQQQELMECALARLTPELRAIFVLREIQDLSYREIAQTLQIKEGTVGSRLNQARTQLQEYLVELGWNPQP